MDPSLKIGLIVPLTGPVSAAGQALRNGFENGVRKVNQSGGANGHDVTYVVADDGGDPATSTQLARKLIQQDRVSILFGTITGDTAEAVGKVADDSHIPFATAILGDPDRCRPYAWTFGESTRQLLTPAVPSLMAEHGKRVAIVGSDYNFPHSYAKAAREQTEAAGGTVVAEEYSPLGQTDWQPVVTRLAAARPDVLLSMVVGSDAVSFTQQAQQFGLLTPALGFDGAPLDADYYPALGPLTQGRTHVVRWTDQLNHPDSSAFAADYQSRYRWTQPVPEVAGNAYFAVQFLAAAVNQAGKTEPEAVNRQIGTLRFDSALGTATHFDPGNHILQANMLEATIQPGGLYAVTRSLGLVPDATPKGCA
ncbi:ABC transporter substrate-binding protein [Kibdelosporangium banguiense]|uniref:ABC transporter substrate-binding protein n=1 Tax=Kibdelosporangium banguiense TaxID=1365924 RepID=UPI001AE773CF|nr:ABC transporter substrate-binding protein [Kibdelosporangium banguiense]